MACPCGSYKSEVPSTVSAVSQERVMTMRVVYVLLAFLPACDGASPRTSLYDADATDAWSVRSDSTRSAMDDKVQVTHRLETWGVEDRGEDAGGEVLLDFHCDTSGVAGWMLPAGFVEERAGVRMRLDSLPAQPVDALTFNTNSDGVVAFVEPMAVLDSLRSGVQLLVEFSPQGRAAQVVRFNLRGLDHHLDGFKEACRSLVRASR